MIGPRYWCTGITIGRRPGDARWDVRLKFYDDGWCDLPSTEGELRMRYLVDDPAAAAVTLVEDAERLGISFHTETGPWVYLPGDNENPEWDVSPANLDTARTVAVRLGPEWTTYGREAATSTSWWS